MSRQAHSLHCKSASKCGLSFEQSSILFNIASLYSQLAKSENRSTEDGFKKAAQYLQQSAGTLDHLIFKLKDWGVSEKGAAQLEALRQMMMAQAQDMFVQKAIKGISACLSIIRLLIANCVWLFEGKMKEGTISKLSSCASNFYKTSLEKAEQATDFEKVFLTLLE